MTPSRQDDETRRQVQEAIRLLACVRERDCGWHYCRYCSARSPEWQHDPFCLYVESQREANEAKALSAKLQALLAQPATPAEPETCATCRHWRVDYEVSSSPFEYCGNPDSPCGDLATGASFGCTLFESKGHAPERTEP